MSEQKAGVWTSPINLAYPMNSSRDDFGIIFNEGDSTGFVSSNRSETDMIYSFVQMPAIFVLQGIASLKAGQLPIKEILITLINETDGDTARIMTASDGKFKFNLLPNKKYTVLGQKEGYFNLSETFETGSKSIDKNIAFKFEVDEIVASQSGTGSGQPQDGSETAAKTYDIGEVFYDYNAHKIRPDAMATLDKLVKLLKDNPGISVEIQSHCDARGSASYNIDLSNRRAYAVVEHLTSKGIGKSRLKSKGFGESQPVNQCTDGVECSEQKHQENRRTEFIVLENKQS
jgi:outer membrane protein OmpA-like peptidoglycan-associated protein